MHFAEHGPLTRALSKLAYDLEMATFATHTLEQSRNRQYASEFSRISSAKTAYDDLVRILSKARSEIEKLENMAFDAYVDAVPDADRTDFPSLADLLADSEVGVADDASDKQDDGEHKQNP